jgi:hypothetical protein
MKFTNIKSVGEVIDVPRYWETRHIHLYGEMDSQVYSHQGLNHLYIPRILLFKHKISKEIKR